MDFPAPMLSGFLDELEKIAVSHGHMNVSKSRSGRRPISVGKLLKKEKDGTLYKRADSQGNPQDVRGAGTDDPGAAKPPKHQGDVPSKEPNFPMSNKLGMNPFHAVFQVFDRVMGEKTALVYSEGPGPVPNGESPFAYQEAKKPRKRGDVPSKDDSNVVDRYDNRESATTVTGLGQHSTGIGAFNSPSEHY